MSGSLDDSNVYSTEIEKTEIEKEVSEPKKKSAKFRKEEKDVILPKLEIPKYKLNYRKPNGEIRSGLSRSMIYMLKVQWPDLLRVIPSDRWVTVDEIIALVAEWEQSSPLKSVIRTRETVERGIRELQQVGALLRS